MLENNGDIGCTYALQSAPSPFGPHFSFAPDHGVLAVGEKHVMTVTFSSAVLGEFSENFVFSMLGSASTLNLHFKGHVVGPTFHLDVQELDFGEVSFEFLHSKKFTIYNTADIPMRFALRVPQV